MMIFDVFLKGLFLFTCLLLLYTVSKLVLSELDWFCLDVFKHTGIYQYIKKIFYRRSCYYEERDEESNNY